MRRDRRGVMSSNTRKRLIVGISGASGIAYGIRVLEFLRSSDVESHLVVSRASHITLATESTLSLKELYALADVVHPERDIGASISSGSFKTIGMVVAPCSMKTLAEIAHGTTATLLSRAADVVLKERRKLVLIARETPLHLGHLRNMTSVTEMGAIVCPPVPALYARPNSIDAMIDHTVGRVLDLFDIDTGAVHRWQGQKSDNAEKIPENELV